MWSYRRQVLIAGAQRTKSDRKAGPTAAAADPETEVPLRWTTREHPGTEDGGAIGSDVIAASPEKQQRRAVVRPANLETG
jgi:hypothetical protein